MSTDKTKGSDYRPEPITTTVIWDHKDPEFRLMQAIQELCDRSFLSEDELQRVFMYFTDRSGLEILGVRLTTPT